MRISRVAAAMLAMLLAVACNGGDASGPASGSSSSGSGGSADACAPVVVPAGAPFADRTAELGIDFQRHNTNGFADFADVIGGGACLFDYDGDGKLDIYLTDRAPHSNKLYRNEGDEFTDVTQETATGAPNSDSMGCLAFDFDGDGDLDLYLANKGPDRILRNDAGVFADVTDEVGLIEDGLTTSVAAGDIDGDGDLDLFVTGYIEPWSCLPSARQPDDCIPRPNLLFENQRGHFVEVGAARGLTYVEPALTVVMFDFDGDLDLDIFVGNDFGLYYQDRLFINDGKGSFQDFGAELGVAWDAVGFGIDSMGIAVGDWDRNGVLDLAETNFSGQPTMLFMCKPGHFCVDSHLEGTDLDSSIPFLNWGIGLVDFDGNGWLDVFTASGGIVAPAEQRNQLYLNSFGNFTEYLPPDGDPLAKTGVYRGASFGDLDGDGDTDIVVVNNAGPPQVLINEGAWGHWLTVELDSLSAGALVTVTTDGQTLIAPALVGSSFLGSSDPRIPFGLGEACSADVTVRWPDGKKQMLEGVVANQVIKIARP